MYKLITGPASEVLSLLEVKRHLRLIGSEELTPVQSIAPGTYSAGETTGTAIDLSAYQGTINLDVGTCAGTLTVAINHRNDATEDWELWDSFDAATSTNDNQSYSLTYDGGKRYIQPVATIETASCIFGVSVTEMAPASPEDTWITEMIEIVREEAEKYQGKAFLTQTWELILDDWPCYPREPKRENYIEIKKAPIQSITSIIYTDCDGVEHTMDSDLYYLDADQFWPRIVLNYGEVWPSETLQDSGAIRIRFVAGYVTTDLFKAENKLTFQWMRTALKLLYGDRALTVSEINHKALEFDRVRGYF